MSDPVVRERRFGKGPMQRHDVHKRHQAEQPVRRVQQLPADGQSQSQLRQ